MSEKKLSERIRKEGDHARGYPDAGTNPSDLWDFADEAAALEVTIERLTLQVAWLAEGYEEVGPAFPFAGHMVSDSEAYADEQMGRLAKDAAQVASLRADLGIGREE